MIFHDRRESPVLTHIFFLPSAGQPPPPRPCDPGIHLYDPPSHGSTGARSHGQSGRPRRRPQLPPHQLQRGSGRGMQLQEEHEAHPQGRQVSAAEDGCLTLAQRHANVRYCIPYNLFFSPTWSFVSLARPTTSSGWKRQLQIFYLLYFNFFIYVMYCR